MQFRSELCFLHKEMNLLNTTGKNDFIFYFYLRVISITTRNIGHCFFSLTILSHFCLLPLASLATYHLSM
jgi:hypothetical protein